MSKRSISFIVGAALGALTAAMALFYWNHYKMTKVYVLEAPMLLTAGKMDNNLHLLPKGTTLYFDEGFPEGFERYKVYVNIDRNPLPLKDLADPTSITPIQAQVMEAHELKRALLEYPLTKKDLEAILKSKSMTRDEIKEVFNAYLESTK